jgi:hypothetical protein
MMKRTRSSPHESSKKRFRHVKHVPDPFGFDLDPFVSRLVAPTKLGVKSHSIQNLILRFERGQPIFQHPKNDYKITGVRGMYATIKGQTKSKFVSELHTSHTVHLYEMAHNILTKIRGQPPVYLVKSASREFKTVDIRRAKFNSRQNKKTTVFLNARHLDKEVVLKTTKDPHMMLRYVLEAVIHDLLKQRSNTCVPQLCFVGITKTQRLIVCSEQLQLPCISTWVNTLNRRNNDQHLFWMLKNVCNAMAIIQRNAHFTHRDCHTGNVYYDERNRRIQFIDFDWSCIRWSGKIISVPRHLYDTTRGAYGNNRSVDMCRFMRCLGEQIQRAPVFKEKIWTPLMQRYEDESRETLLRKAAGYNDVSGELAALQLYKMGLNNKRKYSHVVGYEKYNKEFDYYMGYYEWSSMTPQAIQQFIFRRKFF